MNWSTTGTVKRFTKQQDCQHHIPRDGRFKRTVHAMCTAAGLLIAFRCQPFLLIASPTSSTLNVVPCAGANATTDAGGFPSTRSSGISVRMRCAIVFAAETMLRQESR